MGNSKFCKGGTQTRLKSYELTNSDNNAYQRKAFPPLKKGGQGGFRTWVKRNKPMKITIDNQTPDTKYNTHS